MKDLISDASIGRISVDNPVRQLAQRALIRNVGDRDYSAQETMHLLMGHPQYLSSRTFLSLYLKGDRQLENVEGEPVISSNLIDKYCERPRMPKTASLSLSQFFTRFYFSGMRLITRKTDAVVVPMGVKKVSPDSPDYDNFCRNFLMLHKPFRRMTELKGAFSSWILAYDDFVQTMPPVAPSIDLEAQVEQAERDNAAAPTTNVVSADQSIQDDRFHADYAALLQLHPRFDEVEALLTEMDWSAPFENEVLYNSGRDFQQELRTTEPGSFVFVDVDLRSMNLEQQNVYNEVEAHLRAENIRPLLKIVTGTAGTGKSHLINCLRRLLGNALRVIAPTGVAACNVQGETIHSALRIPIRDFKELSGQSLELLQESWRDVRYIILEEMSMVGLKMLSQMHRRLKQAFPGENDSFDFFGGCSVIMFGDFGQLSPPGDFSMFSRHPKSEVAMAGLAAYKSFRSLAYLKRIMRQIDDQPFCDMLQRIRVGDASNSDFNMLSSRFKGTVPHGAEWESAIHLFSMREPAMAHNISRLTALQKPIAQLKAEHTGGRVSEAASFDDCGLEAKTIICEGARIMLTANLNVSKGLCNGTIGSVVDIAYPTGGPPKQPLFVLCDFPKYTGRAFDSARPTVVPVFPLQRYFHKAGIECSRTTVPLRLAWAITIHKSQGLTLDKAVIDIGVREFSSGLTFVALSRVRKLSDLLLYPFTKARLDKLGAFRKSGKSKLYPMKQEDKRLLDMSLGVLPPNTDSSQESNVTVYSITDKAFSTDTDSDGDHGNSSSEVDIVKIDHAPGPSTSFGDHVDIQTHATSVMSVAFLHQGTPTENPRFKPVPLGVMTAPPFPPADESNSSVTFPFNPLPLGARHDISHSLGIPFQQEDAYGHAKFPSVNDYPTKIINVNGDGHCFFHAMSRGLTGSDEHHIFLRMRLHSYMVENDLVEALGLDDDVLNRVNDISGSTSSYSGLDEMHAMATMLGNSIHVFWPAEYNRYIWQTLNPFGIEEITSSGIYIYVCGTDVERYQSPNHYVLVTHI